jgi:DeoR/GlpR family transcriptional regulator of sugar metabolism
MLAAERRNRILNMLQTDKRVIVSHLSGLFGVSDETIRRDLDMLCKDGLAVKAYGGATLNESDSDLPFDIRKRHNPAEKKRIAGIIEALVKDGESVILDASTTAVFAAKALKNKKKLTVITNSIEVMVELADMHDWHVISTGGNLQGDSLSFVGQRAVSGFSSFYADKLIFSCKGLDANRGVFDGNDDIAQVKSTMLTIAKTKILAVDLSKFEKPAFSKIADIKDIDIIVTNAHPGAEWFTGIQKQGVKCLYP